MASIGVPQQLHRMGDLERQSLLELDPAMVFASINRLDTKYVELKKRVPDETVEQLERMKLPGVVCKDFSTRHYPRGHLMSHVVGYANAEAVGSAKDYIGRAIAAGADYRLGGGHGPVHHFHEFW